MKQLLRQLPHAGLLALALAVHGAAPAAQAASTVPAVFARVGATVITRDDYDAAFRAAVRSKFYHGKPPQQDVARLQREVGERLVARVVLLAEAKRRGVAVDEAGVRASIEQYEKRYAGSEHWKTNKDKLLPPLVARLGEDSQLAALEKSVRSAAEPGEAEAHAYYLANPAQFTEPERKRVAVILLKVEPSAPTSAWIEVDAKAEELSARARAGEDFGALARAHSNDPSAERGGDMGYLHAGMLPAEVDSALSALKVGETTGSLRLLQGLGVFRLLERTEARLLGYDAVKTRALELARRQHGEQAWKDFVAQLVTAANAEVDSSGFIALEPHTSTPAAPE